MIIIAPSTVALWIAVSSEQPPSVTVAQVEASSTVAMQPGDGFLPAIPFLNGNPIAGATPVTLYADDRLELHQTAASPVALSVTITSPQGTKTEDTLPSEHSIVLHELLWSMPQCIASCTVEWYAPAKLADGGSESAQTMIKRHRLEVSLVRHARDASQYGLQSPSARWTSEKDVFEVAPGTELVLGSPRLVPRVQLETRNGTQALVVRWNGDAPFQRGGGIARITVPNGLHHSDPLTFVLCSNTEGPCLELVRYQATVSDVPPPRPAIRYRWLDQHSGKLRNPLESARSSLISTSAIYLWTKGDPPDHLRLETVDENGTGTKFGLTRSECPDKFKDTEKTAQKGADAPAGKKRSANEARKGVREAIDEAKKSSPEDARPVTCAQYPVADNPEFLKLENGTRFTIINDSGEVFPRVRARERTSRSMRASWRLYAGQIV